MRDSAGRRGRAAAVFAALATALSADAVDAPLFLTPPLTPLTFGQPTAIATPDLDGDGRADVVVTHYESQRMSVLLGTESGTLLNLPSVPTGSRAINLVTGKFDTDPHPDVLVIEEESDNMWFLRGLGDGGFDLPRGPIVVGHDPIAAAADDFDEDGILDLVVAFTAEGSGSFSILLGNGDGTFGEPANFGIPDFGVAAATGDFNGDGHADVVASYRQTTIALLLGHGDGTFDTLRELPVPSRATVINAVDLNDDGHLDLVIAHVSADVVSVSLGRGDGTFQAPQAHPTGTAPLTVSVADINGDGHRDAVTINALSRDASILLGDGTGALGAARSFVTSGDPRALASASLDGDAFTDILIANQADPTPQLAVMAGTPNGVPAAIENVRVGANPTAVIAADLNNDSKPDLLLTTPAGQRIAAFLSGGETLIPAPGSGALAAAVNRLTAGDFDGDGIVDAATLSTTGRDVLVLRGRGDGGFDAPMVYTLNAGGTPTGLVAADFTHDGWDDLVVTQGGNFVTALVNDGRGTFTAFGMDIGASVSSPVAGRFNVDGHPDIAAINTQQGSINVLLGDGAGGFTLAPAIPLGRQLSALAVADFNGDGFDDLAATETPSRRLYVVRSDGQGGFAPAVAHGTGELPFAVSARDVDGDGTPDLIVANQGANSVSVMLNDGSGGFDVAQEVMVAVRPLAIASADFNDDGRYDLASLSNGSDVCSLIPNAAALPVLRGDANGDARVSAADTVATVLEVLDGDGTRIEDIRRGFVAAPGVDANGDGAVTPGDTAAVLRRMFSS